MNSFFDFVKAAAPWAAVGSAIAILIVRGAPKKKIRDTPEKQEGGAPDGNYGTEGMCFGMCLGTAIGAALENTGIGISIGMLIGLAIGTIIPKTTD